MFCLELSGFSQFSGKEFIHYTTSDLLSDNNITALAQDRFGYMWIGTERGLNRFDGLNFKQFHSDKNKQSLPSEDIVGLIWVDSNNLAVITRLGINIMNIETMRQSNLVVPAGVLKEENRVNRTKGLLTDQSGNFFVITRTGFYHFNSEKKLVFRYDDYTRGQLETGGGGFGTFYGWLDYNNIIVTGQNGVYHYNIVSKKISKISGSHPLFSVFDVMNKLGERNYAIRQPWPGRFIFFINASDTAIYIDENKKLLTYSRLGIFPLRNEINWRSNLFVLKDSSLLLSAKNSGIFQLTLERNSGKLFLDTSKVFNNLRHNDYITDKHQQTWIATNEGLLMEKKNLVNLQFIKTPVSIDSANTVSTIMQVVSDLNYVYATGALSAGFYIFNKNDISFNRRVQIKFPSKRENSYYTIIKWGNDTVLCGGIAGLFWYNVKNRSNGFIDLPGWDKAHSWIANIFEDSRKALWISTNQGDGCYILENNSRKFIWVPFKQPLVKALQVVGRMAEDSHGNIWMGGNGLARYNIATGTFDQYIDSFPAIRIHEKGVSAIAIDKEDNLWLGNTSNGLIFFEPGKMKFTSYTMDEGLPDNAILALKQVDNFLWIACRNGIAKMDLKTRRIFNIVNNRELQTGSIKGNRFFYDSDLRMIYIGAGSGVLRFKTENNVNSLQPPHLIIENVLLGKDSVIWNPGGGITTSWNNKNITLVFNAINYNDPQDQRYAYRIVNGRASDWILLEQQRRIYFDNLNEGSYRIEIKVFSINNRWPPQFNGIDIIVKAPFWKSWWFFLLCALVISLLIYALFRYRIDQLKIMIGIREKLSQDLHDEVGATLSGIAMYSHLTLQQIKAEQSGEVVKSLQIIQQSAIDTVNRLSDIVWSVNPLHDSLKKLLEKLEEYAIEMSVTKDINVNVNIPSGRIANLKLPMQTRKNIYLICKEAINNAVKYSDASILELTVKDFDHSLEFTIKDNGKGLDLDIVKRGNGLENMQKRADEIGAKLFLLSEENKGTSVCLQCKIG